MNDQLRKRELRLGYVVPEFPGQTHGFFWRELTVLRKLRFSVDIASTRRPSSDSLTNDWNGPAQESTTYLASISGGALPSTIGQLGRLAPQVIARVLRTASVASKEEARSAKRGTRVRGFARQLAWILLGIRLAGLAHNRRWDHVHVHSCGNSAYIAMYASLISGLPYSLTLHGPLSDYGCNQSLKWSEAAFAIIITDSLRREAEKSLGTAMPARVEVTPMGVDVREFSRDKPYEPWSGRGPLRIFSCGRLNPSKGHDVLLEAVRRMVHQGAEVQLEIAGEDEADGNGYRHELERIIRGLGLGDRVHLLGAVSTEAIRRELNRAHVFALASHAEPLGVAIMEAMSMKVPVVAAASDGIAELIEDEVSGILVQPGSPGPLAQAVLRIMQDPNLGIDLGEAGRRRVEKSFGYQRSAEVLAQLIWESANGKKPILPIA